ncbi:MAG: endoribonuclease YbeY [Rhodothermaceae bacterium]|nr:MAG: endoribonuclease YbeY [Rhodothermaceae bacterium]
MPENAPELLIANEHPSYDVDEAALERLARHVLAAEGVRWQYVGIILTYHATVLELNRTYLNHDYHTDVLSFDLSDEATPERAGEVYVDLDTAAERHAEFGASFEEEVRRYVVHGLLHLAGHDDATPAERAALRALEDRYLAALSAE